MEMIAHSIIATIRDEDKLEIIKMVKDYDWEYKDFVIGDVCMSMLPVDITDTQDNLTKKVYKVLNDKNKNKVGFYILQKYNCNWKKIEIKYFFIKPEYRRRGYATRIIRSLQTKSNNIYLDTKETPFIKMISKLGFKDIGLCMNGVETCYHYGVMAKGDVNYSSLVDT